MLEILAVVMGARRQGPLAPQLPRATRSPEFPSEDFRITFEEHIAF